MNVDAELNWSSTCLQHERVRLTLGDDKGHRASVDMTADEARELAHVLTHETHGSCADVWLVEHQARSQHLWLTLSATSRGMVRISRIELASGTAREVAVTLLEAAGQCHPAPTLAAQWCKATLKPLRATTRWAVQHTRPLTRQRQQWMNRLHRALVVLYRSIVAVDRATPMRSH
jgi:hypothetical protein